MKQVKKLASPDLHARVLEYLFHSFNACFSATWKFATEDEIKSLWSEDEIIQYHVLAVDTQEQGFSTTAFVEPIHCAPELAMFEALLSRGQEVSFAHLKLEFA